MEQPHESGWDAYWRANGAHRNHEAPVQGCRYCRYHDLPPYERTLAQSNDAADQLVAEPVEVSCG